MNLNVAERTDNVFRKTFLDSGRFRKEVACLGFLSGTILASLVPTVMSAKSVCHERHEIELSVVPGKPLIAQSMTRKLAIEMGTLLAEVNSLMSFEVIGTLNASLEISETATHFDVFLSNQLDKWLGRLAGHHRNHAKDGDFLRERLAQNAPQFKFLGKPVFCHNDFDFKNIMSDGKFVTGLLDWEFVGAYPMAWELRKITPTLYWDAPTLGKCFEGGYRRVRPDVEFPDTATMNLLVGIDCIGALGWAYSKNDQVRIAEIERILSASIRQLQKGGKNTVG